MKRLLRLFFVLGSLASVSAGTLPDLGQGLSYLRVHALADSLKNAATPGALVVDLRYATADATSAAALQSALAGRPADAPLFILVGPATPTVLTSVITHVSAHTLGLAGSSPAPQVVVKTDAATDRRAYDAFDAGTPLDQLISGKIEKERFDEATLVKEFKNGNPDAAPLPGDRPGQIPAGQQAGTALPAPDPTAPKADDAPAKPAPLTDRVLQRAVHLYHALLALKPR